MFSYINRNWSLGRRIGLIAIAGLFPLVFSLITMVYAQSQSISASRTELADLQLQNMVWRHLLDPSARTGEMAAAAPQFSALGAVAEYQAFLAATDTSGRAQAARDLISRLASQADSSEGGEHLMDIIGRRLPTIYWKSTVIAGADAGAPPGTTDGLKIADAAIIGLAAADILKDAALLAEHESGKAPTTRLSSHLQTVRAFNATLSALSSKPAEMTPDNLRSAVAPLVNDIPAFQRDAADLLAQHIEDQISSANSTIAFIIVGALATLITGAAICFAVARSFTGNLRNQISAIERISHEDETAEILFQDHANETGELAKALMRLKGGVIERKRMAEEAKRQVAEKETTNEYYVREHQAFMTAFHLASEKLSTGVFAHRITEKVIDEYVPIVEEMNRTFERLEGVQKQISKADQQRDAVIAALGQSLSRVADGDLCTRIDIEVAAQFERLKKDFNSALDQLESTVSEVKGGTNAIKDGTDEISQASDDLSRRTESQAASLEETAAAVTEITTTVRKTAEGARQAHEVVLHAKKDAEKSGEVVNRAIQAMSAIENSSKQISQIIGVIDEIAFQTNLLALNAGVEAARAGEAGRGFAVVASEVRALAQRSAEAAKEIKGLISASTMQVSQGVELVGETGQTLSRIVERVSNINEVVSDIASSANEQAHGLSQVNAAVSQMDQATQQNAAMAEQATAATRNLQQQTEVLAQLVARFQTKRHGRPAGRESNSTPRTVPQLKVTASAKATGTHGHARGNSSDSGWEEF
jgi:methyl-accepting chemotaxis protein